MYRGLKYHNFFLKYKNGTWTEISLEGTDSCGGLIALRLQKAVLVDWNTQRKTEVQRANSWVVNKIWKL